MYVFLLYITVPLLRFVSASTHFKLISINYLIDRAWIIL